MLKPSECWVYRVGYEYEVRNISIPRLAGRVEEPGLREREAVVLGTSSMLQVQGKGFSHSQKVLGGIAGGHKEAVITAESNVEIDHLAVHFLNFHQQIDFIRIIGGGPV